MSGMIKSAVSGAATGGWGTVLQFVWNNKAALSLSIVVIVIGIMYGCERGKVSGLTADKATLNAEKATLVEKLAAADKEIAGLKIDVQLARDEAAKRIAELNLVKEALATQQAIAAQTAEMQKKTDELLEQWKKEQDPARKAALESEYWNTAFGIKAKTGTKCEVGVKFCVLPLTVTPGRIR